MSVPAVLRRKRGERKDHPWFLTSLDVHLHTRPTRLREHEVFVMVRMCKRCHGAFLYDCVVACFDVQ